MGFYTYTFIALAICFINWKLNEEKYRELKEKSYFNDWTDVITESDFILKMVIIPAFWIFAGSIYLTWQIFDALWLKYIKKQESPWLTKIRFVYSEYKKVNKNN